MRAIELAAWASSSRVFEAERSTTDGGGVVEDTTEGVPTKEGAGFEQPDFPPC